MTPYHATYNGLVAVMILFCVNHSVLQVVMIPCHIQNVHYVVLIAVMTSCHIKLSIGAKAHLDNFWSEFFEHFAKLKTAISIFDIEIR